MKLTWSACLLSLLLAIAGIAGVVSAYATPESIAAAGNVFVSAAEYDPGTFFTGDTGTLTVYVTNGNANQSVVVNHATISDNNIRLMSDPYDTSAGIGPLQTKPFTFSVRTDALPGFYYPTFSLGFRDADSLYYRALLKVDNTPLDLSVTEKPDAFAQGRKKTIILQIANPRENNVTDVMLVVSGEGITANPDRIFIGDLEPGAKMPVNLSITPDRAATLHLALNYHNGDNPHTSSLDFPIAFGEDKKQADPVMSNVQVKTEAGIYHVTGDVNNAGLETANTVMVTVLPPATPQDPYRTYVVGALKPDDFGSFEVTFTAEKGTASVPVQLSYKDTDGNIYTAVQNVTLEQVQGTAGAPGPSPGPLPVPPVAIAGILVLVFIAGWALYLRAKKKP